MYRSLVLRCREVILRPPGYPQVEGTREKLVAMYKQTLAEASQIPESSIYRKNVEQLTKYRLGVVDSEISEHEVEVKIRNGKFEELLHLAEEEYALLKDMTKGKPWDTKPSSVKIELID